MRDPRSLGSDSRARVLVLLLLCAAAGAQEDAYARYVATAPEFRTVRTVKPANWDTWIYMPWRHRWTVGTGDEGGRFCAEHGINGGFLDYGRGPLAWLEKWRLRFYVDHVAGKGTLFLRGRGGPPDTSVRPVPLDGLRLAGTKAIVEDSLKRVKESDLRLAYALDDEVSTGRFVKPLPWRVHADDDAYRAWLKTLYGRERPAHFVTPDDVRAQLGRRLRELDFSALLDRMSYNDSVFANFLGALVEKANAVDPRTPCGFVGAQTPNLWGGYDYAKFLKKVQFLEVYDAGSAPEIVRSLRDIPLVSTHFRAKAAVEDTWRAWSRFAHGQRGMIAWVNEGWCDWLPASGFSKTIRELATVQGPKMAGASWAGDGIALYYSHPSIQVSWCLDAQPHGKTWPNRNNDARLGTSHTVRKAWEFLLNDAGLQYSFVTYDEVVRGGVPGDVKVLILPACFALSDAEAKRIREFVARGGRVIADFMCGLFDQHGKGRAKGVLDDLFGVAHDGSETAGDFFADRLWVETDQDKGYKARRWRELLQTLPGKTRDGYTVAERRLGGPTVSGRAVYLNLSPLRYLLLREEDRVEDHHIVAFLKHVRVRPHVVVSGERYIEVTRFRKGERELLFAIQNPILRADGSRVVMAGAAHVTVWFRSPVKDVVNERTGEKLGSGKLFRVDFARAEALFLSYAQDR